MLTSEIGEAFVAFRDDYNDLKILSTLDMAVNLLAQKGRMNEQTYAQQASTIRAQAVKIFNENLFQYQPDRLKNLIKNSAYVKATPELVAAELIDGISQSQDDGMSSYEAKLIADTARSALSEMSAYLIVLKNIGLPPEKDFEADVSIGLYLPSDIYRDDLGILADKLDRYDKFFSAISELFPEANKPQLTTVSDGSFLAILAAGAPVVNAVAKAWSSVMQAAIDTIRLKAALDQMRAIGMAAELVEAQSALIDSTVLKKLHEELSNQFSEDLKHLKAPDFNALQVKLRTTTTVFIEDATRGTRLTLQVSAEASRELLTSPIEPRQIDLVNLIEHQQTQEAEITQLIKSPEPARQLSPPSR